MNDQALTLAGIDLPDLMKRLLGNASLLKALMKKFMADGTYAKLAAALASGDLKEAEMHCHSLKGMCGNLSMKELFNLFQQQLALLRAGDMDGARAMAGDIDEKFQSALRHMEAWVNAN